MIISGMSRIHKWGVFACHTRRYAHARKYFTQWAIQPLTAYSTYIVPQPAQVIVIVWDQEEASPAHAESILLTLLLGNSVFPLFFNLTLFLFLFCFFLI